MSSTRKGPRWAARILSVTRFGNGVGVDLEVSDEDTGDRRELVVELSPDEARIMAEDLAGGAARAERSADRDPQAEPFPGAVTRDPRGWPVCDGTTHRGTRNCKERAWWELRRLTRKPADYACARHLSQVAEAMNGDDGNTAGDLVVRQLLIHE